MEDKSTITMLGTGSAMALRCYNTCFYLATPAGGMLVDAGGGNGILTQLQRASIDVRRVRHIFVTHCHTDHIMGVIWVIRRLAPLAHSGRTGSTYTIYGNDEVIHALRTMCALMLNEKMQATIDTMILLREVTDGEQLTIDDFTVTVMDIGSPKNKQYGFVATLPGGTRVAVTGDEPFNERNSDVVQGCDWLMCEAFCLYSAQEKFRPYEKNHSTALDAGLVASHLGVKNLLLYHTEDTTLDTRREAYAAEAARYFHGNIVVPDDLDVVAL